MTQSIRVDARKVAVLTRKSGRLAEETMKGVNKRGQRVNATFENCGKAHDDLSDADKAKDAAGHIVDQKSARRDLSTPAYLALLVILWAVNFPIAVVTFQVFRLPPVFTYLLALMADVLFLVLAHFAGRTWRQAHDAGERGVGWWLALGSFLLGLVAAFYAGLVRLQYFGGQGRGEVVFTTALSVASFLVVTLMAWLHYDEDVAAAERASLKRWSIWRVYCRNHNRLSAACMDRITFARRQVNRYERVQQEVLGAGGPSQAEPAWVTRERKLIDLRTAAYIGQLQRELPRCVTYTSCDRTFCRCWRCSATPSGSGPNSPVLPAGPEADNLPEPQPDDGKSRGRVVPLASGEPRGEVRQSEGG